MKYSELIQDDLKEVEVLLRQQAVGQNQDLQNALDIIFSSGGKRIRPIVTLLTGKIFSAPHEQLITISAAIEMLHTATLVHDDLIDGALLRRGLPTLNSKWSPGATVLTGDFMFARAAELAASANSVEAMKIFARTLVEIVNGELTQLFTSKCNISRENYYQRIYKKTASLFKTCCCTAALISQSDQKNLQSICDFGYEIGMAFQIMDDILDFTGEQKTIGKPVASDLRAGLVTLPAIIFFETYPDDPAAIDYIEGHCAHGNEERIHQLVEMIRKSDAIDKSLLEAQNHVDRAINELVKQPPCAERDALEEIAAYIIERKL